MDPNKKYQRQLLEQTQYIYHETPISEATQRVYFETPRHLFIKRYREWGTKEWHEVTEENLEEHIPTLYTNKPLTLFGEDDQDIPSTISQPCLVLRMLDMLQLGSGQTVFELGAGSGWNAALIGRLVGQEGHVYSLEVITEVAKMAGESIRTLGLQNVSVIEADGGEGYAPGSPYDRAVFTAGAYDLPRPFYEQIKDGGLLLIVIKTEGGGDTLFLLRKKADHFESIESLPCGFVQMRGRYHIDSLEPVCLDALPKWNELKHQETSRTPFWWGGKGRESFKWRTLGIRSFLSITEPSFRAFKTEKTSERSREEHYFGLWDEGSESLVIAKDDNLISYGSEAAKKRLLQTASRWVELGMPTAASFALRVYPCDFPLPFCQDHWIVKRSASQFLWSLER